MVREQVDNNNNNNNNNNCIERRNSRFFSLQLTVVFGQRPRTGGNTPRTRFRRSGRLRPVPIHHSLRLFFLPVIIMFFCSQPVDY